MGSAISIFRYWRLQCDSFGILGVCNQYLSLSITKMMMLCKNLRPKHSFLSDTSCLWLLTQLRIGRNTSPATHFFSTEALESTKEDGNGLLPQSVGRTPEKVELTKTLLRKYGFTNTQLSKLYTVHPQIFFTAIPEKTLVPKLDFFRGIGFSNTDFPSFICSNPAMLTSSLQNQIVPCYNFIKTLLLSDSDEDVVKIMKRIPRLLTYSLEKRIGPSVAALREAGVPHNHILFLLRQSPSTFGSSSLGERIKKATEMGFSPNKLSFVDAIRVFTSMSKSTWDRKVEVYRKCGMSDAQFLMAFRSRPIFMQLAEENVAQTMDFVVNKMGWQPVDLARYPTMLMYSLEKRIIPRCTVVRYLQGKGLLGKNVSLSTILLRKEKDFLDEFVNKYENDVPRLMDIYLGRISP